MPNICHRLGLGALVLCTLGLGVRPVQAELISGTGLLGSFEGSLSYSHTSATAATLTVYLKNTSNAANGGYLTAFVFNNPLDQITGVTPDDLGSNFELIGGSDFDDSIVGGPHGMFDIGGSTGGNYEGGGPPSQGLAPGASATFIFKLIGVDLDKLTTQSFIDELSEPPADGEGHKFFVARFRGFTNKINGEDSDKVPAVVDDEGGPENDPPGTPEPASLTLAGAGLLGWLGHLWGRRKRKT